MTSEEQIIEFEAARIDAMERYFAARPHLYRTRNKECLFEAGFRMAWQVKDSDLKDALQGMLDLYERLIPHIKDAPVTDEDVVAEQKAVNLLEKLK